MKEILKYLKKSIPSLLLIILLLVIQANCDLALPSYSSNIINIGISQKGIDETTPKVIRQSELEKILLFVNEDDIAFVKDNYKLITNEDTNYIDEYPLLETENLYILNTENEEIIAKLDNILGKPILVLSVIYASAQGDISGVIDIDLGLPTVMEGVTPFEYIGAMDAQTKELFLSQINEKLNGISELLTKEVAISYISNEYTTIGIDVEKIQTDYTWATGFHMLAIALISMLMTIGVGLLGARVAARLGKDLRNSTFAKVLSLSTTEIKKFGVASLITRTTNDIQQIQMLIVIFMRVIIYAPIIAIGAIIKVMATGANMTWIIALAVYCVIALVITLLIVAVPNFEKVQKLLDKLNLTTREIITGIPVIRAFSNQKYEEKRFDNVNRQLMKVTLFVERIMAGMMPTMMLIMNSVVLLTVWVGAKRIDAGTIQLGDMMAFIQYAMQIIISFLMISMMAIFLPRAMVSIKRIGSVLAEKLSIKDPENPDKFYDEMKGLVEFRDVSFRYPDADEDVLSDISFTAKSGETTAFIGATGSGKSTLINLIPRLFDATKGEVMVDGVNVKNVKQYDLHKKIGYIPQKGILFSGTIESNIKYGDSTIDDKTMEEAAKIAQASDFIKSKKKTYESPIAQGGTNVSGGQKQRLSIARAIAKNPEIYIFDDSFSALDFKTDKALRESLHAHIKDATILIVAQRINTIMNANQIVILDNGKIVGIGTHKELLKTCNVYKEIALSQLSKKELEKEVENE